MFNVGSGKPETLTPNEISLLQKPIVAHGINLAYPKMLFVERVSAVNCSPRAAQYPPIPMLFITAVSRDKDFILFRYFMKREPIRHWVKVGTLRVHSEMAEDFGMQVLEWGLDVPPDVMPQEDQSPFSHYARMTLILLAILMRRGDEVEQVAVKRDEQAASWLAEKEHCFSVGHQAAQDAACPQRGG